MVEGRGGGKNNSNVFPFDYEKVPTKFLKGLFVLLSNIMTPPLNFNNIVMCRKELERARIRAEEVSPPQHEEYYVYRRFAR